MIPETQVVLGKILTNRITNEIKNDTLRSDTDIIKILDMFLAGDRIALEQHQELTALIKNSLN